MFVNHSAPPGDLPNPGIKPRSPTFQADSLLSEPPWKPNIKQDSSLIVRRINASKDEISLEYIIKTR